MSVTLGAAAAPAPPGRLGEALDPAEVITYLTQLESWVAARRSELDEIDQAATQSARTEQVADDVVLSMALWKSVSDRYAQLIQVFAGGRVSVADRERLSTLIWGRLETPTAGDAPSTASAVSVSLPEACKLSDALASALRASLGLAAAAEESVRRIRSLRAQLERIRDQVALESSGSRPAAQARLDALTRRLEEVTARAERGADVGGLLAPLEADATVTERDLIVGSAKRRDVAELRSRAVERYAALEARAEAVRAIADEATALVTPAPLLAVPDVTSLGEPPSQEAALAAYADRLVRVGQALDVVEQRYRAAVDRRTELVDRLAAYAVKAAALGVADHADARSALVRAQEVLERRPAPVEVAGHLVAVYAAWVDFLAPARGARPPREELS
ncbi:MAG: hypothetical protein ACK5MP_00310 [Nostocoides sp.]